MIAALRDLALTSVKLVEERLRLLGAELQEEKWRAVEAVLWLAIALVLGALALLVASLAVVLSVWPDPHARILALLGLAILYGAGALFAFLRMRKRTIGEGMPFADTVAEFQRDRECGKRALPAPPPPDGRVGSFGGPWGNFPTSDVGSTEAKKCCASPASGPVWAGRWCSCFPEARAGRGAGPGNSLPDPNSFT